MSFIIEQFQAGQVTYRYRLFSGHGAIEGAVVDEGDVYSFNGEAFIFKGGLWTKAHQTRDTAQRPSHPQCNRFFSIHHNNYVTARVLNAHLQSIEDGADNNPAEPMPSNPTSPLTTPTIRSLVASLEIPISTADDMNELHRQICRAVVQSGMAQTNDT